MARRSGALRVGFALFLGVHGLIHVIGFLGTWQLAAITQVSAIPTMLPGLHSGDAVLLALGAVWFGAMVAFLVAAVGAALDRPWWRPVAATAAFVSLPACILWWGDAAVGIVADVIVLLAVVVWPRLGSSRQPLAGGVK